MTDLQIGEAFLVGGAFLLDAVIVWRMGLAAGLLILALEMLVVGVLFLAKYADGR